MLKPRYELKYPITLEQKRHFLAVARHGLAEDPHGVNAVYRVSSQYFDSYNYLAYWEKLDGERVRRKFRLRYYSIDGNGAPRVKAAFMEIKHRIDHVVYKERVRVTEEGARAILTDSRELLYLEEHVVSEERTRNAATIETVARAASVTGFQAVNVISYVREAWIGSEDERLRLTFDSSCSAYPPGAFFDVGIVRSAPLLPDDNVMMEIKFDHAIPIWLRETAVAHGIQIRRFSKYAAGVEALGLGRMRVHS